MQPHWSQSNPRSRDFLSKNRILSPRRLADILSIERNELETLADLAGRHYRPFDMRKVVGKGKWRHIDNPQGRLKWAQSRILRRIFRYAVLPPTMCGGVKGRSIVHHAAHHLHQPFVVALDIKNFFPSVSHDRVFGIFHQHFGVSRSVASILTKLTTFQDRLPQGAPTSPVLANLSLLELHDQIDKIAEEYDLQFSIYVDDLAISGANAIRAISPICALIQNAGFGVSHRKIKIFPKSISQELTGLAVNNGLDIPDWKKLQLREAVLELADTPNVTSQALHRMWSQIHYVKSVNPTEWALLTDFGHRHLPTPPTTTEQNTKNRLTETRLCNRYERNHRG